MGKLLEEAEQLNQNYSTGKVNDLLIKVCREIEKLQRENECLSAEPVKKKKN